MFFSANINARDNFKWTPLHHACHSGQLNVVEFLIEHGAEIDATTMNGGTPLTRAIESSKENVVAYLISRGVRVQTENKKGKKIDNIFRHINVKTPTIVVYLFHNITTKYA